MLGGRPFDVLMAQFIGAHKNATNQNLHLIGIPTLLVSGVLWALSPFVGGLWVWPALLMPLGFAFQFVGHAIEGNRPEVFSDWRFFFIGIAWWWALAGARLNRLTQ